MGRPVRVTAELSRGRMSQYAATYRPTYTNTAFNFYEYRARAYNPKLGGFMSEDPKLFDAGDYTLTPFFA